ncbi:MAG: 23S rRNA (guanosine(2251)-2'-O)-methyltransferase RlmB [Alphaproteobacteria bacterium CG_4_10_14_0_2_um_filter_63_37]|nr:MAG: 23S rRNA (guanosine(2251)-2'-O)-methyltransferase RlmB [Proteobacteria bacterium CG1_02_64_396]PJA24907.1 MAG: 23S rRNA (guanosine(2251)-2'-O)-methyltransferase RlmB [Alphaproteobacteria bacterium CG_4_10_14_0_2_um_filter_63_37]
MDSLFGIHPITAALEEGQLDRLWVREGKRHPRLQELVAAARKQGVGVKEVPLKELDRLAEGGVHQGIVATLRQAPPPLELEDWLETLPVDPLVVLLDGVTDPHNLGAIIRSVAAAGGHGVIVPKDRRAPLSAIAVKASAGTAMRMPLVQVTNLARTVEQLQQEGFMVWAAAGDGAAPWDRVDLKGKTALVLGAEGEGVRPLVRKRCDGAVAIPMAGAESLNVSVAAGVLLFEAVRQRR